MNSKNKIILVVVAILAIAAIIALGIKNKMNQPSNDNGLKTIRIACNLPMTGDVAVYGESVRNGYNMALGKYEQKLRDNGIKIVVDYQDNKGESKNAVSVAQKQLVNGFDIYVSGITQQTFAIKDSIDKTGKPHYIWSFYPLNLSEKENLLRTWVDYDATLFVDFLKNKKELSKVACVYQNHSSSQELFNTNFIPQIKDDHEIVYNEAFDLSTTNFKDIVAKIKSKNPDVIFVSGFKGHIIQMVKEFNNAGLKDSAHIVFTFDLLDALDEMTPAQLENLIAAVPKYCITPSPENLDFKKQYEQKYKRNANYTDIYAFDGMSQFCDTIIANKGTTDADLLNKIKNSPAEGIIGRIEFAESGALKNTMELGIIKQGIFAIYE